MYVISMELRNNKVDQQSNRGAYVWTECVGVCVRIYIYICMSQPMAPCFKHSHKSMEIPTDNAFQK